MSDLKSSSSWVVFVLSYSSARYQSLTLPNQRSWLIRYKKIYLPVVIVEIFRGILT